VHAPAAAVACRALSRANIRLALRRAWRMLKMRERELRSLGREAVGTMSPSRVAWSVVRREVQIPRSDVVICMPG